MIDVGRQLCYAPNMVQVLRGTASSMTPRSASSLPRLSFSGGTLVLEGAARKAAAHTLAATPGVWDARVGAWRCDAIHYPMVLEQLHRAGWDFEDQVPAWHPVRWPRVAIHSLRPEQQAAVQAWQAARRRMRGHAHRHGQDRSGTDDHGRGSHEHAGRRARARSDVPVASPNPGGAGIRCGNHRRQRLSRPARVGHHLRQRLHPCGAVRQPVRPGGFRRMSSPAGRSAPRRGADVGRADAAGSDGHPAFQCSRHTPFAVFRGRHTECACYNPRRADRADRLRDADLGRQRAHAGRLRGGADSRPLVGRRAGPLRPTLASSAGLHDGTSQDRPAVSMGRRLPGDGRHARGAARAEGVFCEEVDRRPGGGEAPRAGGPLSPARPRAVPGLRRQQRHGPRRLPAVSHPLLVEPLREEGAAGRASRPGRAQSIRPWWPTGCWTRAWTCPR